MFFKKNKIHLISPERKPFCSLEYLSRWNKMAQPSSPNLSSHTITRVPSNSSLKSTATISSVRTTASSLFSTTSSQRRRGILGKIGTGIESMFRRITRTRTTLTEIETQILATVTDFSRDEILQW